MPTMQEAENLAQNQSSNTSMGICTAVGDIGCITDRIYNHPHRFLDDSYDTRKGWYNPTKAHSYVIPFPQETQNDFIIRKSATTYRAFLKSIVDTIVEPLFTGEFTLESKSSYIPANTIANKIRDEFNLKLFCIGSMKSFYLHSLLYTIVEPKQEGESIDSDLPVVYNIDIDNIVSETKIVNTELLTEIIFKSNKSFYDIENDKNIEYYTVTKYTQTSFQTRTELYKDEKGCYYSGENKPKNDKDLMRLTIDDKTITGFEYETLPIVVLKEKEDMTRSTTPEMFDLAIACWDYFNTGSLSTDLERKSTSPVLTIQYQTGIQEDGIIIGAGNALGYPKDLDRPGYLELDMSAHQELRTSKDGKRQEIYKLFLQGLQTDETKFTSSESKEVSENLFYNKVSTLSEFLKKYVNNLILNIAYVQLDGETDKKILKKYIVDIEISYNFDFDRDKEVGNIAWYQLLADLTEDDEVKKNKLIEELEQKLEIKYTQKGEM